MKKFNEYSILMSVYYKENPEFLRESIESMLNQTKKSNDFVIVCDGPLTKELYGVINSYKNNKDNNINLLQLDKNYGLGIALNKGLEICKNEVVARMDSDDISISTRCEEQLNRINQGFVLVGAWVDEFEKGNENQKDIRVVPENYDQIRKFSKYRNPFNHPSVMFLKSSVVNAGGYQHLERAEDYYIWLRIMLREREITNIQKVLVHMRVNRNFYSRRNNNSVYKSMKFLHKFEYKNKIINKPEEFFLNLIQLTLSFFPKSLLKYLYNKFLRK